MVRLFYNIKLLIGTQINIEFYRRNMRLWWQNGAFWIDYFHCQLNRSGVYLPYGTLRAANGDQHAKILKGILFARL